MTSLPTTIFQLLTTAAHRRLAVSATIGLLLLVTAACGGGDDATPVSATTSTMTTTVERPTETIDELVATGHGRLHVRCSGEGDATVLLIAGWDHASGDWAAVEPSLAERARVCAYDRFGTGTSDAPTEPQTFGMQVTDLHALLDAIGESGPYVVVGHSFGGPEAVTFAATYPTEVAGVVLVDASPVTWPDVACSVPAYAAGCALMHDPVQGERLDVFPAFEAVSAIDSLGDLPMTVLAAPHRDGTGITPDERTRLDRLWEAGTERWAELSTRSTIITVQDTGHAIQSDQPAVVIDEITALLP